MKGLSKKAISLILILLMISSAFSSTIVFETSARDEGYLWPVPHTKNITSYFGSRIHPISGKKSFHSGIDISASKIAGKEIVATKSGTVYKVYKCPHVGKCPSAYTCNSYGNAVVIKHSDNLYSVYAHMYRHPSVKENQFVAQGELLGYVGSTGSSTGSHLHFELKKSSQYSGHFDPLSVNYSSDYNDDFMRLTKYEQPITLMTTEKNVKIRNKPYVEGDVMRTVKNIGSDVVVVGYFINERKNHVWYKTNDGYWVYSERVQAKSQKTVTYMQTASAGKKYTKVPVTLPVTVSQETDKNYVIQGPAPTRDGYGFLGWATKDNATKVEYNIGDTIAISDNLTLYPVWKKTKADMTLSAYEKSFDLTKGSSANITLESNGDFAEKGFKVQCVSDNPSVATATGSGNPVYKNYLIFDKFSDTIKITALAPGKANIAVNILDKNNKKVVTQSIHVDVTTKYKISYNGVKTQEKTYNKVIALLDYIPEEANKFFLGWTTKSGDENPQYGPGDLYTNNAALTLYPVWTTNDYIKYTLDGNGKLTIEGNGIMPSYPTGKAPWNHLASQVKEIVIANGVRSVGANAFVGFTALEKVSLPYSVTSIGSKAFYNCKSLKSINFPTSIQKYGDRAFANCTALNSVTIEGLMNTKARTTATVEIGSFAFEGCTNLASVEIPETVSIMGVGVFTGCNELESVSLPETITEISDTMFFGCSELQNVDIPNSVEVIGDGAFAGCMSISNIVIPESVSEIGDQAFSGCSSLTEISIPESVDVIGASSFSNCSSIEKVELPDTMDYIGNAMFSGCKSLIDVELPENLSKLGNGAFSNCTSLESISIPDTLAQISSNAFSGCTALSTFKIPETVTEIGDYAFYGCQSLKNVETTEGLVTIGVCAFGECEALENIEIPVSVRSIGDGAFMYCTSLETVGIYESELSIGDDAFSGCSSLKNIYIPEGTVYLGENVFGDCSNALNVTCFASSSVIDSVKSNIDNPNIIYPVESIELNYENVELLSNKTIQLNAIIKPNNATFNNVKWSSDCEEVATVSEDGLVTGKDSGVALITATSDDGQYVAKCTVNVKVPVESIAIDCDDLDVLIGNTYLISYSMVPTNPTIIDVEWSSSDPSVATIDQEGYLTANSKGTTVVTVKSLDGNITDSIKVTVDEIVYVESITLNKSEINMKVGEEYTLSSTIAPNNATFGVVEWYSYDESIATIDSDGKIVAVSNGTTTISAISLDEKAYATCVVTVGEVVNTCTHKDVSNIPAKESTCLVQGNAAYSLCNDCGKVIAGSSDKLPLVAHNMSEFVVTKKATCTEKGIEKSTCSMCTYSETRDIKAMGHSYNNGKCTNCGDSKIDNCSCNCHKGGISKFFFKLILFFQKIFKTNKVCKCGIEHY